MPLVVDKPMINNVPCQVTHDMGLEKQMPSHIRGYGEAAYEESGEQRKLSKHKNEPQQFVVFQLQFGY